MDKTLNDLSAGGQIKSRERVLENTCGKRGNEFASPDILEDYINDLSPDILNILLKDHTMSTEDVQCNIFWASHDYEYKGKGYEYNSQIYPELITGENGNVIQPRVLKSKNTQTDRSKDMAEVFTPAWICNAQINLVDEAWFGRKNVFNEEYTDENGCHSWIPEKNKITFPDGKTWRDYVCDTRLEVACGEAPYVVSRYDATTGRMLPIEMRVGMLDRKLRIAGENTTTSGEWLKAAQEAYKSIYAYEWQGDSLLLAREAMLVSFIDYYRQKFDGMPLLKSIRYIAYIISWNVWQMDGLKGVVPDSCHDVVEKSISLFGDEEETVTPCEGCQRDIITKHNGKYCLVRDWNVRDSRKSKIRFIDLLK